MPQVSPHVDYGRRVRAARAYKGILLDDLATAAGISKASLQRMEAGERPLSIVEAHAIADATGVPLSFLVHGWPNLERDAA